MTDLERLKLYVDQFGKELMQTNPLDGLNFPKTGLIADGYNKEQLTYVKGFQDLKTYLLKIFEEKFT